MSIFGSKKNNLPEGYKDRNSGFYIPDELRDDYQAAIPSFGDLTPYLRNEVEKRAEQARQDAYARHKASKQPGRDNEGGRKAYEAVIQRGVQAGDEVRAEHYYRLEYAEALKTERDAEAAAQRARHEHRCRVCEAMDVSTAPVVVRMTEPHATRGRHNAMTVTLPGGPVCVHCTPVVAAEYVATTLAAGVVNDAGTTRREAARRFVKSIRT